MHSQKILLLLMQSGATMPGMHPIAAIHVITVTQRASLGAHAADPTIADAPRPARRRRLPRPPSLGRKRPAATGATQRPRSTPATNQ